MKIMLRPGLTWGVMTVALACGCLAAAEDWPEFRGPTGQGLSAARGLPAEWGPAQNIAWKRPILGSGWSSPVVSQGRIYLTAAVPVEGGAEGDHSLRAMCLSAGSGEIVWDVEVFAQTGSTAAAIHSKNSHASPTPLIDGGRLFVHFGHQGIACLDLSGKVIWRNADLHYEPVHGSGGSPVVVDDLLVFSCDGRSEQFLVALNRSTGGIVWKTDREVQSVKKFSFSTPLVITVGSRKQIISPASDMVAAYDSSSGQEIWRVRYEGGYSVIPRPVYGHGLVYISTGYDRPRVLAIRPDGNGDVTDTHVEWTLERGAPHTPCLLLVGDELYMVADKGVATCVDAHTGSVHWQERLGGNYSSSPIYADGKIYFQSEEGTGIVVKADKQFEQLASNALGERTLASYAVTDRALVIRTDKHVYRIEAQ